MYSFLFAQDAGGADVGFLALCRRWADVASVLGFALSLAGMLVSLVGFFLTLRGQRRIREAAEGAARRAAYQIAVADVGTLLRQVEGMRDAVRHQIWLTAVFRGGEARLVAMALATNDSLTTNEQASLRDLEEALRLAIQYIEQRLLPQGHGAGVFAAQHRRELDRSLRLLGELRGRLQHVLTEL
ncbi:MAG TPA: hypothetical protein VKA46_37060 [Gemmataceae bacterium]|nr:hypothetical protein [Gemmataceae bacterium]